MIRVNNFLNKNKFKTLTIVNVFSILYLEKQRDETFIKTLKENNYGFYKRRIRFA